MPIIPPRPHLTRIPGELPKSPPEQHLEDISKLSKIQLLEIKERQEKLLCNKFRISKLPDKGKRIQDFYDKVLKELEHRDEIEKAAKMFSELNIASNGQRQLTNLEWTGKCDSGRGEVILDSDDEEVTADPLKIIAQSATVERKVKYVPPEKSLITEDDLKEIESFKAEEETNDEEPIVQAEIVNIDVSSKVGAIKPKLGDKLNNTGSLSSKNSSINSLDLDPHVLYLFEKGVDVLPQKERFKPFKTTKSNVHDPEKEKLRKPLAGKHWEVTAATPPPLQHAGTKLLSLQDSVEIQTEYLSRLKKLQEQQAEERLKAKTARLKSMAIALPEESAVKVSKFFGSYRDALDVDSSDSEVEEEKIDSDEGVRDEEEEKGGVNYVVYK